MKPPLVSIAAGLVLAGIIHISIILLVPNFASQDAWTKLKSAGPEWQFSRLNSAGQKNSNLLSSIDPLFQISACRYSLTNSALQIEAFGDLPFWSVAIFDRFGKNIYSFNNRTAIDRKLNLLVVSPVQMSLLRQDLPDLIKKAIVVESNADAGFVLIRALQADPTWETIVDNFLGEAKCERFKP